MKRFTGDEDKIIGSMYADHTCLEIGQLLDRNPQCIKHRARKLGLSGGVGKNPKSHGNNRLYTCNESFFGEPNLLNSYWAGFIGADGCLMVRGNSKKLSITLSETDRDHLERFRSDICYTGHILDSVMRKQSDSYSKDAYNAVHLVINSKRVYDDLYTNFNIVPRKSKILKPPKLSGNNALAYAKGYIDGDGSIFINQGRIMLSVLGTREVCLWIKGLLSSMSLFKSGNVYPVGNIFRYTASGRSALCFLNNLKQIDTPLLERKWKKLEYF